MTSRRLNPPSVVLLSNGRWHFWTRRSASSVFDSLVSARFFKLDDGAGQRAPQTLGRLAPGGAEGSPGQGRIAVGRRDVADVVEKGHEHEDVGDLRDPDLPGEPAGAVQKEEAAPDLVVGETRPGGMQRVD